MIYGRKERSEQEAQSKAETEMKKKVRRCKRRSSAPHTTELKQAHSVMMLHDPGRGSAWLPDGDHETARSTPTNTTDILPQNRRTWYAYVCCDMRADMQLRRSRSWYVKARRHEGSIDEEDRIRREGRTQQLGEMIAILPKGISSFILARCTVQESIRSIPKPTSSHASTLPNPMLCFFVRPQFAQAYSHVPSGHTPFRPAERT